MKAHGHRSLYRRNVSRPDHDRAKRALPRVASKPWPSNWRCFVINIRRLDFQCRGSHEDPRAASITTPQGFILAVRTYVTCLSSPVSHQVVSLHRLTLCSFISLLDNGGKCHQWSLRERSLLIFRVAILILQVRYGLVGCLYPCRYKGWTGFRDYATRSRPFLLRVRRYLGSSTYSIWGLERASSQKTERRSMDRKNLVSPWSLRSCYV